MPIWQYIILFLSVLFGGSLGFLFNKESKNWLQLILSFSGAYILGITVLHLMPWVFGSDIPNIGLWVIGGFFAQIFLEQLSVGVEHGHIHAPHKYTVGFVISVMLGLSVHAFVEGIPLSYYGEHYMQEHGHSHTHNHLLYGIILHHIPAALALVILLKVSGVKKRVNWLCLSIFAAMSPLGAAASNLTVIPANIQTGILAFAVGSLLHIATVILFEMDSPGHHKIPGRKLIAITLGIGFSILTIV
ncbi:MAG TPA: zinc/iron permease [Bacteroidetes bacterium]|nr:zinc/iron permease [Bacteroidota bacterium]